MVVNSYFSTTVVDLLNDDCFRIRKWLENSLETTISVSNGNVGHNMYYVKSNKLLYGLKQSERMWYNWLKEFLLNKCYYNNDNCTYFFEGPEKTIRGGVNGSQSKFLKKTSYISKQIRCASLLARLRPHSYWRAIGPQNRVIQLKTQWKH
jgi:hypothetical protein